ncbi:MAG: hypothetical protein HZC49_04570 [Nitrospirae bacterium]|nr:hypothetical protein [Nitrospirota bacterium]
MSGAAPVTVTINLAERVWFVRNNAGAGQGNDQAPFQTLAQAETASDVNDTIFVYSGDLATTGQDVGITLKSGQKLIGEGVGLSLNGVVIVPAATAPKISNAALIAPANIPVVMLATGNEVAGLAIEASSNEAILALSGTGHNLHNNTITFGAGGREGIRLLGNVTGNVLISNNTITGALRDGIKVTNNEALDGANVAPTPMVATVTMNGNTIKNSAQDGIRGSLNDVVAGSTSVTLIVQTNTIENSGTAGADEGINIDSFGSARVTAGISGNTISISSAEAIDLSADGNSIMSAEVSGNRLANSQGVSDFLAQLTAGSTGSMCLELFNNVNTTLPPPLPPLSTFTVNNNAGVVILLFEGVNEIKNDTAVDRNAGVGGIDNVLQGACNIPAL